MSQLLVREARLADYDDVARVTVDAYRALRGGPLGGYERALRDVATRAAAGTVLVAVVGDELCGAVAYVPGPHTEMSEFSDLDACGLRMLAVDPARQGHGAGRALVEACVQRGRTDGRRRVLLHSTAEMVIAHHLYDTLGFRRDLARDVDIETEQGPLTLMGFELVLD